MVATDTRCVFDSIQASWNKLTACQRKELALAAGDRLQLKANGRSVENRKLVNGELVTVEADSAGWTHRPERWPGPGQKFPQFVRATPSRPTRSQGKSVDHVLFSDSTVAGRDESAAMVCHHFARAKRASTSSPPDKEQLRENITRSADRPSVMDLLAAHFQNDWFYRQIEQRWGRRAEEFEAMRQKQMQIGPARTGKAIFGAENDTSATENVYVGPSLRRSFPAPPSRWNCGRHRNLFAGWHLLRLKFLPLMLMMDKH